MQLSSDYAMYVHEPTGEAFIMKKILPNALFYRPSNLPADGFFELKRTGYGGSGVKAIVSFEDPHHHVTGTLKWSTDNIDWNGKIFLAEDAPSEIEVQPLPSVRKAEYLFRMGKVIFYVSADTFHYSYESFKLYTGTAPNLHEIPITRVERYRDGGTTEIYTAQGILCSPTPSKKEAKPTWNGAELEKLNPEDFNIVETEGKVSITRKKN